MVLYIVLILVALFFLLPFVWILRCSMVSKAQAYMIPPDWGAHLTFENYVTVMQNNHFGRYFLNSLFIGLASTALSILLGALAAVSCWFIQAGCGIVQLRGREKAIPGAVCCVIWLILGAASGMIAVALIVIGSQLIAGFAAAYGGRRSDTGRQAMAQIAGLRRHMRKVSPQELQRICQSNPDYFHQLAPYALALEVDKAFAKRFGRMSIPKCSYLIAPTSPHMTAMEWSRLLRDAAEARDERQKLLPFERFIGR